MPLTGSWFSAYSLWAISWCICCWNGVPGGKAMAAAAGVGTAPPAELAGVSGPEAAEGGAGGGAVGICGAEAACSSSSGEVRAVPPGAEAAEGPREAAALPSVCCTDT